MRLASALVVAVAIVAASAGPARAGPARVAALQVALRAARTYGGTIDGIAGRGTVAGVRRFQAAHGLAVDGVAGPHTRRALGRRGRPRLGSRALEAPDRGWDVAELQFLLETHGFPLGTVDGGFGLRTAAALVRFQSWAGLAADGIAGPATLARLRRRPPRARLRYAFPVAGPIGDRFGPRGNGFHPGIDFPVPRGTPVHAAGTGCVSFAGSTTGGYGKLVVLRHSHGMTSWYAHLSSIAVGSGRCVRTGTFLGRVGSSGFSTGPHLHFELRLRGAAVDPLPAL